MDAGNNERAGAGTRWDASSANTAVLVNGPRHHPSHRRSVRGAIPVARRAAAAPVTVSATTLAPTRATPTYTLRPRNRTDGGVERFRHPSRPQQRLKRRATPSTLAASTPPRGLRG